MASESSADRAPAVARAVRVLDLLAESQGEPQSLTSISKALGAAKSSTLNVCAALEDGGLLRRTDAGYVLGRRVIELGGAYLHSFDPVLEFYRACAESEVLRHERCQLAVLEGTNVLYLATHVGRAPFRLSAGIGSRYPASITAVGNALLAELADDEIDRRFADDATRPAFTPDSTTSLAGLKQKLADTRQRGHSLDRGEVYPGLAGFAIVVPPQSSGEVPLALGASMLESEFTDPAMQTALDALIEVGRRMSNPMNLAPEALAQ
ncbi:IclR family transcriptional regulator [Paramicrobacterium agarici]|uniref:IclR family transcriptional regulator n=1 Tax=Paramicrobacterium agarici TaxID=630514 RepID=A0A2A9DYY7_9MICO|nr:IclR family transcriptional regulator [Microbacterium agarici]PFG31813.1 IclR family transcriptional regulator [Microbacterium agarici]TQO21710.1 IclR family transcriptional regulator [Microbacterium agarici]